MRAGVPEGLKCAHGLKLVRLFVIPAEKNRSCDRFNQHGSLPQDTASPPQDRPRSTKTHLKVHTGCCRVHRKRKRLTSNGSIESDAVLDFVLVPEVSLAASLPIEC